MKIKLTFLFLIAAVVGSLPVKADDKTKQSQLANEKIEKAIKALGDENFTKRRKAYAILEAEKLNAIPLLLRHRLDPDTELQKQVVKLLKKAYRFEIRSFSLNKATLAEACLRLTEVSGVQVCAEGEAKQPITINLKATTFWTVVLHICRQGRVGLAPHHTHTNEWVPGSITKENPVVLGQKHPLPEHAYVDGPALLVLSLRDIYGEFQALMRTQLRFVPGLPLRVLTSPRIKDGKDNKNLPFGRNEQAQVKGIERFKSVAGGRTFFTIEPSRGHKSVSFKLSGRLLVFDGIDRLRIDTKIGSEGSGPTGPHLKVVPKGSVSVSTSADAIYLKLTDGPGLKMPSLFAPYTSRMRRRLTMMPIVLDEQGNDISFGGGAGGESDGAVFHLSYQGKPRWVALDYISSYREILWNIEVKDLPIQPPLGK